MGGLFSTPDTVEVPVVEDPTVLPDEAAAKRAKKKSLAEQQARGGRQSTILSTSDKLG